MLTGLHILNISFTSHFCKKMLQKFNVTEVVHKELHKPKTSIYKDLKSIYTLHRSSLR